VSAAVDAGVAGNADDEGSRADVCIGGRSGADGVFDLSVGFGADGGGVGGGGGRDCENVGGGAPNSDADVDDDDDE